LMLAHSKMMPGVKVFSVVILPLVLQVPILISWWVER